MTRRLAALLAIGVAIAGCEGGRIELAVVDGGAGGAEGEGMDGGGPARPDLTGLSVPEVVFEDVTAAAGLPSASTMCLVFSDLDGDHRPDLLLAGIDGNGLFAGSLDLWRNRGDGTFARTAIPVGLSAVAGCRAVDWNGDGVVDLIAAGGLSRERRVAFLEGRGGGAFAEVTKGTFSDALAQPGFVGLGPIGVLDLDGDRRPDVVLGNFAWPDPGQSRGCVGTCAFTDHDFQCHFADPMPERQPPLVYRNVAGKRFERVMPSGLRAEEVSVFGAIDWDGDGNAELFAADDFGANALYRVDGKWNFSDLLGGWRDNPYNHGMGVAFADFDRDGRWDFHVTDLGPDRTCFGLPDGTAEDRAGVLGIEAATRLHSGWAPLAEDWNGDGWVDLFVANSVLVASDGELGRFGAACDAAQGMGTARPQADFLFVNQLGLDARAGFAVKELPHPGTRPAALHAGAAAADYDGDGDVDLAIVIETQRASVRLLRNDSPGAAARTLAVRLVGAAPATDALGATVRALSGGREVGRRLVGGGGSLGESSRDLHFGCGELASIDALEVRWPSGKTQMVAGPLRPGTLVTVEER